MKVFDGFRLSADGELTDADFSIAQKLAVDTRIEAEARGLFQLFKTVELPGGGTAFVQKAGDFLHVHLSPLHIGGDDEQEALKVPDFGSGYVTRAADAPWGAANTQYLPTAVSAVRLGIDNVKQALPRYTGMSYYPDVNRVIPRASQYTGRMRELMQYFLGVGKPPDQKNKFSNIVRRLVEEGDPPLQPSPDVIDAFASGVDYSKFAYDTIRTHGLCRGPDNTWWVVEISRQDGLFVMPLQYFAGTTTPNFIEKASAIDAEVALVLSTFGGLPSPDSVPDYYIRDMAMRAGIKHKIAPPGPLTNLWSGYYYGQSIGWSFNYDGTEARQCLYGNNPAAGRNEFQHWLANFAVTGYVDPPSANDPRVGRLSGIVSQGLIDKGYGGDTMSMRRRAILLSKIPYMTESDISEALSKSTPAATYDFVDSVQVNRITATGGFTLVESGPAPWWDAVPPFTYYEVNNDRICIPEKATAKASVNESMPLYVYHNHNAVRVVYGTSGGLPSFTQEVVNSPGWHTVNFVSYDPPPYGLRPTTHSHWLVGHWTQTVESSAPYVEGKGYTSFAGSSTHALYRYHGLSETWQSMIEDLGEWDTGPDACGIGQAYYGYIVQRKDRDFQHLEAEPTSFVYAPWGVRSGCVYVEVTPGPAIRDETYDQRFLYHSKHAQLAYRWDSWRCGYSWVGPDPCGAGASYPHIDFDYDYTSTPPWTADELPFVGPYDFTPFLTTYGPCTPFGGPAPTYDLPYTQDIIHDYRPHSMSMTADFDQLGPSPVQVLTDYQWGIAPEMNVDGDYYVYQAWNMVMGAKPSATANSFGARDTFVLDLFRNDNVTHQYTRGVTDDDILAHRATFVGVVNG